MRRDETKTTERVAPKEHAGRAPPSRAAAPRRASQAQPERAASKRETLNVRIKREDRALIDRAARLSGKSRTDFLLEAGRRAATDTLLDQCFFQVDAAAFAAFAARLDASPRPNDRLKRMLQQPAPWDK